MRVEPSATPGAALNAILEGQRRFALVARPNPAAWQWLREAPPEIGGYFGFNLIVENQMAGWAAARVFTSNGQHLAELLDLVLADDAIGFYPAAVRHLVYLLAAFGVDAVFAATSCSHTLAALQSCRFRLHHDVPLYGWWKGREAPGSALVTGSHAEHAFFPTATAGDSVWQFPGGAGVSGGA
jgi:hypothetical protein